MATEKQEGQMRKAKAVQRARLSATEVSLVLSAVMAQVGLTLLAWT